ncbi:MAG: hypothetical protein AAF628_25680, partial [Planctomycetota bacterium]
MSATPWGGPDQPPNYREDLGIEFSDIEPVGDVLRSHYGRIARTVGVTDALVAKIQLARARMPVPESDLKVEITNELGLSLSFDAGEVLHCAVDQGHSLGEQAQLHNLVGAKILRRQVDFMRELDRLLPHDFECDPLGTDGLLRVRQEGSEPRILNLWTLPLEFDLAEADSKERFLRLLAQAPSRERREAVRVHKELHSRQWLAELLQQRASAG